MTGAKSQAKKGHPKVAKNVLGRYEISYLGLVTTKVKGNFNAVCPWQGRTGWVAEECIRTLTQHLKYAYIVKNIIYKSRYQQFFIGGFPSSS